MPRCWHDGVRVWICLPLWGTARTRLCSAKGGRRRDAGKFSCFLVRFRGGRKKLNYYHARMGRVLDLAGQTCLRTVTGMSYYCSQGLDGCRASLGLLWFRSKTVRLRPTPTPHQRSDREEEEERKITSMPSDVHVPARFVSTPIFFYQLLAFLF